MNFWALIWLYILCGSFYLRVILKVHSPKAFISTANVLKRELYLG